MAAARRWAGGRGGASARSDDALTASARMPERKAATAEQAIELSASEVEPVGLFLALDTQWRRHPMTGARLGLDYAAIEPTARMMEIVMSPPLLADLRAMERAAMEELVKGS